MTPQERLTSPDPSVDQAYSEWHRRKSLGRFVDQPELYKMIDIDGVEIRGDHNRVAAIVETTREPINSKLNKSSVSHFIARCTGVPFYVVRTQLSDQVNEQSDIGALDIAYFEVCHVNSGERRLMQPSEYAAFLARMKAPLPVAA